MTSGPQSDDGREALFLADFYPGLGAWLAQQYASGYDAEAGRARFLAWLGAHADGDALADYRARVARVRRLTNEEEADLGRRLGAGRRAQERLAEGGGALPSEARAELERVAQDGLLAGNRLMEANLWLVVSLAGRFAGRGVPFSDLVQEGNQGLIRAVQKYDPAKGYRFPTYATWWIRRAITRAETGHYPDWTRLAQAITAAGREQAERQEARRQAAAQVLARRSADVDGLATTEHGMLEALGREPTAEELAAELDLPHQ
jgi:RNA polymerase primary sigma factor